MAWRRPGAKPLSEPMMVSLLTHICVTRPQWVNSFKPKQNGWCFVDGNFKRIFLIENVRILFKFHWNEFMNWKQNGTGSGNCVDPMRRKMYMNKKKDFGRHMASLGNIRLTTGTIFNRNISYWRDVHVCFILREYTQSTSSECGSQIESGARWKYALNIFLGL